MKTGLFALAVLFAISPAFAQAVHGTLLGTVTDVTGGAVAGAKVTILETNTRVSHSGETNASGNYDFPDLPPGQYNVMAEMEGFKREMREGVLVEVDTSARADLKLQPGNVSESIEVTAAPALLQTDRADTGRTMDAVLVEELPLGVNRNFQSLLDLMPGTSPATFQHSQAFNAGSSLQTESNGQPRMGNNFQIEGIDNNQRTGLLQILITPAEAIQTVSISTSNHDPELGRGTGAVTNVILKSGTNAFHGAAYEFLQNSALDARAFFNPSVGHLTYNYAGGNIGGPIRHGKIFFFADYLRTMDHEANTNLETIPSVPFRSGDLSAGNNRVYNPFTGNPDGSGREPFPGNQIPASLINPISAKILSFLPAPNLPFIPSQPSNNYFALLPFHKDTDALDGKIDDNLTDKDRVSARFSFSRPVFFQAPIFGNAGGPAQGAFEDAGSQKTYSAGLNYNRIVTSTLLTEVRVGVAHYHNEARQSDYGINDTANLGIPGVNVGPFTSGFVGISIGAFSSPLTGYSPSLPWIRAEANIDLVNTWTKIAANHTIKWGVDIRRIRDDLLQDQTFSPRGVVTFGGNQTFTQGASGGTGVANDFASFLLDVPSKVARDINTYFPALRAWQVFGYVADNWQVSPKLTLNLGVRWELYPPPTPQFPGGFSNYDYVHNQLVIAGVGGNPSNLGMVTHFKQFAPRLGLAYRLTNSTVIRAGFGVSYTPFPDNNWAYNFPVRANNQYDTIGGLSYTPAGYPDGTVATFQRGFPAPQPIVIPANGIIANPDPTTAYTIIPLDYKNPYVETWNLAVQQALPFHFVLDAAYVANHGVDTPAAVNLNAGLIPGAGSAGQPQYPRTAATTQYFRGFSSSYNSLQVKFDRRFATGVRMTTSFTWQKGFDYQSSDDGGLRFYLNQERNHARADFDRTLNFIQSYIYELPFGKRKAWFQSGAASKILGGWQVSGILSLRTGTPLLFTANSSLNLPGATQTPNQIAPIQILHGINIGNPWFSTASFATPRGFMFGTMGRNELSGPGMFGLNASVSRQLALTERFRLSVRMDSFNVTNTPQFANPQLNRDNTNFGFITSTLSSGTGVNGTGGGRYVQAGVKLIF